MHKVDARIKLVFLFLFSLTVFLVKTWLGVGIIAGAIFVLLLVANLPIVRLVKLSIPLLVLLAFIWLCNAFTFNVVDTPCASGNAAGFMAGWYPIALWGNFGFNPQGCMIALIYAVRILVVFFASYVVSFTTTAEALSEAFSSIFSPLQKLKVPVDDIATVLSLAIRFIPLMAAESERIRNAQISRGAAFDTGALWNRIFSWRVVLIPLVVAMFRRAAMMGQAMEARCYGAGIRTRLHERVISRAEASATVAFIVVCAVLIVLL